MGFFDKLFHGFYYDVNKDMFKKYLQNQLDFSIKNHLETVIDMKIHFKNEKHNFSIWNFTMSNFESERKKGLSIYYDEEEFKSLEDFYNIKLINIPEFFKIEMDYDDIFFKNKITP